MEHFILKRTNKIRAATRGQATIEFILVMVVALAYIAAIVQPNADYATSSIQDVANLGKLKVSAGRVVNALEHISIASPGSAETVEAVIPTGSVIICNSPADAIRFEYNLVSKESTAACANDADNPENADRCSKAIPLGFSFACTGGTGTPVTISPGIYSVKVDKDESTGIITAAFSVVQ